MVTLRRRLRIAVLGIKQLPATGGADRAVEKLLEHGSQSHEYFVYVKRQPAQPSLGGQNVHYVPIPTVGGKHAGPFVYFLLCTAHYLVRGHYDLAHVHNSDFGLFCALLRLKRRVPIVGTFQGDPYLRRKWGWFARWYLRLSERCFVQFCDRLTSASRFKASARGFWRSQRVTYIPNGVDVNGSNARRPHGTESRFEYAAHGIAPGAYILFGCGRLDRTKGLHHLLQAYQQMDRPERLLVVGDFTHDHEYSSEILTACARDGRIVVHAHLLDRDRFYDVVRNAKVLVFPSEVEAMSLVLLEAVAARCPVVCSDIPENVEVVGESYPYLYAVHDAVALRDRLLACLDAADRGRVAQAVYARCAARFGWPGLAAQYESIYQAIGQAAR